MLTALASTPLAARAFGPGGYAHGYGPGYAHFGFPWFALVIPLFWLAVIVVAVVFGRRRWRRNAEWRLANGFGYGPSFGPRGLAGSASTSGSPTGSAEQTLADRFARGDIDAADYRARLDVLRTSTPTPTPGTPAS